LRRSGGLEEIVSKRRDAPYKVRPLADWLKIKNPESQAAKRIAETEW
jgi:ATP-dependent DNA ligase